MKTYSETKGIKSFNWFEVLNKAIKNPPSKIRQDFLIKKSVDWVTCACGNLCFIIPREQHSGKPVDEILSELGSRFYYQIEYRQYKAAISILKKIEKRSIIVINQLKKQWEKAGFKITSK